MLEGIQVETWPPHAGLASSGGVDATPQSLFASEKFCPANVLQFACLESTSLLWAQWASCLKEFFSFAIRPHHPLFLPQNRPPVLSCSQCPTGG